MAETANCEKPARLSASKIPKSKSFSSKKRNGVKKWRLSHLPDISNMVSWNCFTAELETEMCYFHKFYLACVTELAFQWEYFEKSSYFHNLSSNDLLD